MSYKVDLSDIEREGSVSITQQLVDRFTSAIEAGELAPGVKLPPTRELAAQAGVNHLTAARVYRKLAELGYVTARVGRGTFVRNLAPASSAVQGDDWQVYALPPEEISYSEQVLADTFSLAGREEVISLATGWPAPSSYPTEELARITADVFADVGGAALSYLNAEGLFDLREQIAVRGREYGYARDADEVVITSGAQQALSLSARAVLEPGDVAAIESPTFIGMMTALRGTGAKVIGVPVDGDGFDVGALERLLARHEVKLVGLQSACQNPTGTNLSEARRAAAGGAGRRAQLLRPRGPRLRRHALRGAIRPLPPRAGSRARALHQQPLEGRGRRPALGLGGRPRAGARPDRDAQARGRLPLSDADPAHRRAMARTGAYDRHVERTIPFYRKRRDALLAALERHMPGEYRVDVPHGGHHLWVTLNRALDERALYGEAARHGVTFTPGGAVTAERRSQTSFRLSFSMLDPDQLDEGARRLGRAIREVRRRAHHAVAAPMS